METNELINDDNIVELDTTFEESLESWFYLVSYYSYKWSYAFSSITKDGQYDFLTFIESWNIRIVNNNKNNSFNSNFDESLNDYIVWIQEVSWFRWEHNPIDNIKTFNKDILENVEDLTLYLIDLEKEKFNWEVKDIINK